MDLGDALEARPTTIVAGKLMQRGGPDTAGNLPPGSFICRKVNQAAQSDALEIEALCLSKAYRPCTTD